VLQDVWSCTLSVVEYEKTEGHCQAGLPFEVKGRVWKLQLKLHTAAQLDRKSSGRA